MDHFGNHMGDTTPCPRQPRRNPASKADAPSAERTDSGAEPGFVLGRVNVGLGNRDHFGREALAQANVEIGPFTIRAFITPDGQVTLPYSLRDEALAHQIAVTMRLRTVEAIEDGWAKRTAHESQRLLESQDRRPQGKRA